MCVGFRAVLDNLGSRSLECLPSIAQILITVTAKEHGSFPKSVVRHTVRRTFGRPYVLPLRPMLPVPRPSITKLISEVKSTEQQSVCVIVNHAVSDTRIRTGVSHLGPQRTVMFPRIVDEFCIRDTAKKDRTVA